MHQILNIKQHENKSHTKYTKIFKKSSDTFKSCAGPDILNKFVGITEKNINKTDEVENNPFKKNHGGY